MITCSYFLCFTGFLSAFSASDSRCKPAPGPSRLQPALHSGTTHPGHRALRTWTRVYPGNSHITSAVWLGSLVTGITSGYMFISLITDYLCGLPFTLYQVTGQPLSPTSQQPSQELSPTQLTPVTLAQSHTLQTSSTQQQGTVQHAYIPGNWNYRGYRESRTQSPGLTASVNVG